MLNNKFLCKEILEITLSIDSMAKDLIVQSGGIHQEFGTIMNPSIKGDFAMKLFEKTKIKTKINRKINFLKNSKNFNKNNDKILVQNIEELVGLYFNSHDMLFTKDYLYQNTYSQICLDLFVVENAILMLLTQ